MGRGVHTSGRGGEEGRGRPGRSMLRIGSGEVRTGARVAMFLQSRSQPGPSCTRAGAQPPPGPHSQSAFSLLRPHLFPPAPAGCWRQARRA